jgi:post-segregation antitoxin (ccd killing protein)
MTMEQNRKPESQALEQLPPAQRWLAENIAALENSNAWVKKNGLPLARYRCF